jgi:glycosyltransferase involved in cell wall biosynthesis
MPSEKCLLVSIDFRLSSGGISRVAHLMHESKNPFLTLSYFGSTNLNTKNQKYFNQNIFLFGLSLFKAILIHRPNVLLFDHVGPAFLLVFVPNFLLKKVIIFLHDEEAWLKVNKRHELALSKASHILCNSDYTFQRFVHNNPKFRKKTHVCLLAGVPQAFENEHETSPNKEVKQWAEKPEPYLIFVSRLWQSHRYKGHLELVKGFSIALNQNQELGLRLAIVGRGDDEATLLSLIAVLGLQNHVKLFQNTDDYALKILYQQALALFFPSIREGFGFVFLEAMYFAKACIGIKGQPAEEILNSDSGILLADNEPETIASAILDISMHKEKYVEMGKQGKIIYREKFSNYLFKQRFTRIIEG